MPKKCKILMITSELSPFAKTGGLADVVASLSIELATQGHDVRVILPLYQNINRKDKKKCPMTLRIPLGNNEELCGVYQGQLLQSKVIVYFLEHEQFFNRTGIYGPKPGTGYTDNAPRFAFLDTATFELCRTLQWFPDIMHCHDWQSALVPVYLQMQENDSGFVKTVSVFTIHNLGYQGLFTKENFKYINIPLNSNYQAKLEKDGYLNFLQAGLLHAHMITTVSPTYAQEICTPQNGHGLDDILRKRQENILGILNVIDYTIWNPSKDHFIKPYTFSEKDLKNKIQLKIALQKSMNLVVDPDIPMVAMVTRLCWQKGFDTLLEKSCFNLYGLCKQLKLQFIILGEGEKHYACELRKLQDSLTNLRVFVEFNNCLAHQIISAADFFLIPSVYEPCGLTQMYSLRYGTLPIVHKVGGLKDTIINYKSTTGHGTGFFFNELTPFAIFQTIKTAINLFYEQPKEFVAMQKTAMAKRFNWDQSARHYVEAYRTALKNKHHYC